MMRTFLFVLICISSMASANEAENIDQKIQYIQNHLDKSKKHTQLWQNGWLTFFAVNSAGQGIASGNTSDSDDEYDFRVRATTSLIAATEMLLRPMETHQYAEQLKVLPSQTLAKKEQKLAAAESFLNQAVKREQFERSLEKRIMPILLNALAGAAIAFDDDRESDGAAVFIMGVLASEVKIRTAPNALIEAQKDYEEGRYHQVGASPSYFNFQVSAIDRSFKMSYHF